MIPQLLPTSLGLLGLRGPEDGLVDSFTLSCGPDLPKEICITQPRWKWSFIFVGPWAQEGRPGKYVLPPQPRAAHEVLCPLCGCRPRNTGPLELPQVAGPCTFCEFHLPSQVTPTALCPPEPLSMNLSLKWLERTRTRP